MMKYPIGIQSFPDIRERGFVYVDKTAFVYRMALMGKFYFLSRPRRFGKSLLVSTMEAYFLGRKELFKGLAIEKLETEWKTYPVLHLDLNAQNYVNEKALQEELDKHLVIWEQAYGMAIDKSLSPETRFYNVIRSAYIQTGSQVVVLVDEYDKPLLATIDNDPLHDAYRNTLKAFFSVLKSLGLHHGREQVQPRQHFQRPEQPDRHLHASEVCRHLRHLRGRTAYLFRWFHP